MVCRTDTSTKDEIVPAVNRKAKPCIQINKDPALSGKKTDASVTSHDILGLVFI